MMLGGKDGQGSGSGGLSWVPPPLSATTLYNGLLRSVEPVNVGVGAQVILERSVVGGELGAESAGDTTVGGGGEEGVGASCDVGGEDPKVT